MGEWGVMACVTASIVLMIALTSKFKFNIFLSMFVVSLFLGLATLPAADVVPAVKEGFGGTMKSIGVIIVLGIMIGLLLEKTSATTSLALAILRLTGRRRADLAVGLTGFVTGIPIFCDSGFVVLSGLNKSLVARTGRPPAYLATLLAVGLYSVHCLIPPHPGALAAAGIMKAGVGSLLGLGLLLAVPGALAGFAWARWATRREQPSSEGNDDADVTELACGEALPPVFRSFLPILVPVLLLSGRSVLQLLPQLSQSGAAKVLLFLGQPEIALTVGVALAASLLKRIDLAALTELLDRAIEKAGPILVLTGAGGIFGAVIKATGAGELAGARLAATGLGLFIPFAVAAFLKTALGSSTVAMMTAASVVAPMLGSLHLDGDAGRLLATLAMGAGSMVVSHANDSYFWVVTRFSGIRPDQTLKTFTTATAVVGATVFAAVLVCAKVML